MFFLPGCHVKTDVLPILSSDTSWAEVNKFSKTFWKGCHNIMRGMFIFKLVFYRQ